MPIRILTAAAAAMLLMSCQTKTAAPPAEDAGQVAPILDTPDAVDAHSYARPLEARVTHVKLDLNVDFAARQVGGTATLAIQARPSAREIILDDKGLQIEKITDEAGQPLAYQVGANDENLGAPLAVQIGDKRKIVIRYKSSPGAGALQWLTPEQTAGKKYPYLLSQGEAIDNRSWIPTQDSPGIRQTWEARIRVPKALTAVMSAPKAAEPFIEGDTRVFSYKMDKPVAPYLIAIAVGDLAFRELGPRTGVWTEPAMLDKAAA